MTERQKEICNRLAMDWQEYATTNGFLPYLAEESCDVENRLRNQIDWLRERLLKRELAGTKAEGLRMAEEIAEKELCDDECRACDGRKMIIAAIRSEREKLEHA